MGASLIDMEGQNSASGIDPSEVQAQALPGDQDNPPKALGYLLDEPDEEKVAQKVVTMLGAQEKIAAKSRAMGRVNEWRRKGYRWATMRTTAEDDYEAVLPVGSEDNGRKPSKMDRLLRRMNATLLADAPLPKAIPLNDSDDARDGAEAATRIATVYCEPQWFNMRRALEAALDKSHTYRSGFLYLFVDPTGGGSKPKAVQAHPAATDASAPLVHPDTGLPPDRQQGEDYVQKYVTPQGSLSDSKLDADIQWLPKVDRKMLDSRSVFFLPPQSPDGITSAKGVMVILPTTMGDLRATFPEVKALSPEDQRQLAEWRPKGYDDIMPKDLRDTSARPGPDGNLPDTAPVITIEVYYKSHAEYPKGARVVVGGPKLLLHRQPWCETVDDSEGGKESLYFDLPVVQVTSLRDDIADDPYGVAWSEKLGPMQEIDLEILEYQLNHLWRAANPIPFLPAGSIVQPKALQLRDGTPVYYNTDGSGKPIYETVPEFPESGENLRKELREDMNDEVMLQQAAQGTEVPSVNSGVQADTIIQQAQVGLSQTHASLGEAFKQALTVMAQFWRAYFTAEQRLQYQGEDGAYKDLLWTGADLKGTTLFTIAPGSYTMLSAQQKEAKAYQLKQAGAIDDDELQRLLTSGADPLLGIEDNPHRMRVRREIVQWQHGPTPEFEQAYQAQQQQQQLEQSQAMQAQSMGLQPPPMQPPAPLPIPFVRRPVDMEPAVALVRHNALSRAMEGSKFATFPPEWQQVLVDEYNVMRTAAGIYTLQEQANNAQNQLRQQLELKVASAIHPQVGAADAGAAAVTELQGLTTPPAPPAPPQPQMVQ